MSIVKWGQLLSGRGQVNYVNILNYIDIFQKTLFQNVNALNSTRSNNFKKIRQKMKIKVRTQCLSKTLHKLLLLFSVQINIITLLAGQFSFFRSFSCWENKFSFNLKRFCYSYSCLWSLCEWGTSFARDLSQQNSEDSYLCFRLALLLQCLTSVFSINTFFVFVHGFSWCLI